MSEEEKRVVGRPTKYRTEYCDMLVEHMSDGASITSFAAEIDVSRSTITEWEGVHPEFSASVKRGKAKCAAWWEKLGRSGAMGADVNPTLVIFGLKNMAADDWRDKQEIDMTQKSTIKVSRDMTPQEAAKAYQDLMNG